MDAVHWRLAYRADPRAVALADRHYNRQSVGSKIIGPPGRTLVLLTEGADALWVSTYQRPEYTKHGWPGAWVCTTFRNESSVLSSDLIREAVAVTRWAWGTAPAEGFVTFVDPGKTRRKRDPGRCYRKAGWTPIGETKGGLVALGLAADEIVDTAEPVGAQLLLTA